MTQCNQRPVATNHKQDPEQYGEAGINWQQNRAGTGNSHAGFGHRHAWANGLAAAWLGAGGNLETAQVQRRKNGRGRHPHQQSAQPSHQSPPQVQCSVQPLGVIKQRGSGRRDGADHLDIGMQKSGVPNTLVKRNRKHQRQKHESAEE